MCHGEHYRCNESIKISVRGKEGTGMSFDSTFLSGMMTEDQLYRNKFMRALTEIKYMIQPFKDHMDIFKAISKVLERCDI